jgi:hypothetical protein
VGHRVGLQEGKEGQEGFLSFPGQGEARVAVEEVVGVLHGPRPGKEEGGLGVGAFEEVA